VDALAERRAVDREDMALRGTQPGESDRDIAESSPDRAGRSIIDRCNRDRRMRALQGADTPVRAVCGFEKRSRISASVSARS